MSLLLYVLRFECLPTLDSALHTRGVRFCVVVLWLLLTPYRRIITQRFTLKYELIEYEYATFLPRRLHLPRSLDDVSDFGTCSNLVHPSGLICSFCLYCRDFSSNFLSHGSLPPLSCSSCLGSLIIGLLADFRSSTYRSYHQFK